MRQRGNLVCDPPRVYSSAESFSLLTLLDGALAASRSVPGDKLTGTIRAKHTKGEALVSARRRATGGIPQNSWRRPEWLTMSSLGDPNRYANHQRHHQHHWYHHRYQHHRTNITPLPPHVRLTVLHVSRGPSRIERDKYSRPYRCGLGASGVAGISTHGLIAAGSVLRGSLVSTQRACAPAKEMRRSMLRRWTWRTKVQIPSSTSATGTFTNCASPLLASPISQPASQPKSIVAKLTLLPTGCLALIASCFPWAVSVICSASVFFWRLLLSGSCAFVTFSAFIFVLRAFPPFTPLVAFTPSFIFSAGVTQKNNKQQQQQLHPSLSLLAMPYLTLMVGSR